jgi:hypothetical protein
MISRSRGFFEALVGDGRPLIIVTGLCLALAGVFALFQSATGHFLPQDVGYLGMSAPDLCGVNECRIVHFMFHDRVSFGGALIAIAVLYFWLSEFPLRAGEPWAWWTLTLSGFVGFGSFLTYLGYGYLDTWHAAATVLLLPCFIGGLWQSYGLLARSGGGNGTKSGWRTLLAPTIALPWRSTAGAGRMCLLVMAVGMIGAGFTIQTVGMTGVFVQTDLVFLGLTREQLNAVNPRLIPLIAHDRAGFGGATSTAGLLTFASVWWGTPSRSLWQAIFVGGIAGWATAIGVHPAIGYLDPFHLAPAVAGAVLFVAGLALTRKSMLSGGAQ